MNSKDFNELVEARCSKIKATLASKGKEYSTDDDKLHNFNKAGIRSGQSREKALMGMKLKHEISIDDIILNLDKGILPTIEIMDEKIGDIINYFVLLEACLLDRIRKNERKYPLTSEECFKAEENSLGNFNYKNKEGQELFRGEAKKILMGYISKFFKELQTFVVWQVKAVNVDKGIFTLKSSFGVQKDISYWELSNEELWKEDS